MTEQEMRIAIAEACGWKCIDRSDEFGPMWWQNQHLQTVPTESLPDYVHDLNAMRQVIVDKICGGVDLEDQFLKELNSVIESYADSEDVPIIHCWTMAQLCAPCWALAAAFVRTFGKWRE